MVANVLLLIAGIWFLGGLVPVTHYFSPRIGFAPLLMLLGMCVTFTQAQLGLYIDLSPDITIFYSSNVLVPVILFSVLVVYVANGAVAARAIIFGILGVSLLVLVMIIVYRWHLSLPGGGSTTGLSSFLQISTLNLRVTAASLIAFFADMFVIAIFYQGTRNLYPHIPEAVVVGLALLASLWTDAVLFGLLSDLGTANFARYLPGDLMGKTFSALVLWPFAALYIVRIAPRMPHYVGGQHRRTFDILLGSIESIRLALSRAEAALENSETARRNQAEYLSQIMENTSEGLWLCAPDQTQAFFVNPAYERIWGRSAAEFYADENAFIHSLHPEDRDRVQAVLPLKTSHEYDIEYRILRPDGSIRWVRDRSFPIYNEQGGVYRIAGICEDVTERKEIEQHQIDLELERRKFNLLRDFISEASHDLKSPLTAINLKIYQLNRLDDPVRRKSQLDELQQLSNRMNDMIDDLFMLSRLENLDFTERSALNVDDLIEDIFKALKPLVDDKHLNVEMDFNGKEAMIEANRDDMRRALINLIQNAILYTPDGGNVSIQTRLNDDDVVIKIMDTGIGIAQENLSQVFNRFFRASNARSTRPNGSGLGLAIVKKIIESHAGHIEVQSVLGQGTTFTVRLPSAD